MSLWGKPLRANMLLLTAVILCAVASSQSAVSTEGVPGKEPAVVEAQDAAPVAAEDLTPLVPLNKETPSWLTDEEAAAGDDFLGEPIPFDRIRLERLYEAVQQELDRGDVRISVSDVVGLALERSQDIQIIEYGVLRSYADIMAARGEFDPLVNGQASYTRASQSTSSETVAFGGVAAVEFWRTQGQLSLEGRTWLGTGYSLGINMQKEETTYNNYVEEWNGGLTLSITQPLLRGFGFKSNMARIRQAKNAQAQAEDSAYIQVMQSLGETVRSYWDLVGAIKSLEVQNQSLRNAERLLSINESREKLGTAAPLEIVQAQAGVATRQGEVIAARARVRDAEDVLRNALSLHGDPVFGDARLLPMDAPAIQPIGRTQDESIGLAMLNRHEIQSARLAIENADIERRRAGKDLLPQLDVGGSVTQGGRGHFPSDVFDGIKDRTDYSYSVTVQGQLSLRNRVSRGQYDRAKYDRLEAEQRLVNTQEDISLNVMLAYRQAATNQILVESNRQAVALQETNVEAEERKLRLGVSTSFEVLRMQEDLAAAQTQEVQSMINYEKALVDLHAADGTLLEYFGVDYEPPARPEPTPYFRSLVPPMPK